MSDEGDKLIPLTPLVAVPGDTVRRLLESFLSGRNERTQDAYRRDLEDFRSFVNEPSLADAARVLLGNGLGEANGLALSYRAHLLERKLSPATVNRRLAALRSLVRLGRTLGFVPWALEIKDVPRQAYRETRGPGRTGFVRLLMALDRRSDAKGVRDRAILRLAYDLALRRNEIVSLDLEHLDIDAGTVAVLGKGRLERQKLTLPVPTIDALRAWLTTRGADDGPLFKSLDPARHGERLTGKGLYKIIVRLGQEAGIKVRPHGLRHAAITEALELTGGDLRAVQRFSRHRDVRILSFYDDNREDLGGNVAKMVAAGAASSPAR